MSTLIPETMDDATAYRLGFDADIIEGDWGDVSTQQMKMPGKKAGSRSDEMPI